MKKLILMMAILSSSLILNAQVDNRTKNQIKAKFLTAQDYLKNDNCQDALSKINEIEQLSNGQTLAAAQNLKVKCLIKTQRFGQASKELYLLEGLNLSNEILSDIASYSSNLDGQLKEHENKKKIWLSYAKFNNGLAPVIENGKWGFINTSGDVVVPLRYNYVQPFKEGLAKFIENDKHGFLDKNGNVAIEPTFESLLSFGNGLASFKEGEKWGAIDINGQQVISPISEYPQYFQDGLAKVYGDYDSDVYSGYPISYINTKGKAINPVAYDDGGLFYEGLSWVRKNNKYGFINKINDTMIPFVYDSAGSFKNGLALVSKDEKHGFINKDNDIVIPLIYDRADYFSEDLALIKKNGNWGYINLSGSTVIPLIYDGARPFSEGLAMIKEDGPYSEKERWGFINKNNDVVIPFIYDKCHDSQNEKFINGIACVSKSDQEGVIDKNNNVVIPFEYERVSFSYWEERGLISACTEDRSGCSLFTKTGRKVSKIEW